MKLNLTESELLCCISNATRRIIKEMKSDNEFGIVGEEDPEESPILSDDLDDENIDDVEDVEDIEDVDGIEGGEEDEISGDLSGIYGQDENGEGGHYFNPNSNDEDDYEDTDVDVSHIVTDLDVRADKYLIMDIKEEFGIEPDTDVHSGNVTFDVPLDMLEDFKAYAEEHEFDAESSDPINENCMPCEPFKVTTNGNVFWMRESKPVSNVDTFKFRIDEGYRKQCWKNYTRGKFIM